jgi:hypothetical protein
MSHETIAFEGEFKLWAYDVSHSVLLIRHNPTHSCRDRIDIRFDDVWSIQIGAWGESICIEQCDWSKSDPSIPLIPDSAKLGLHLFRVTTKRWSGWIVAECVSYRIDQGGIGDPSSIYKPGPLMKKLAANGYALD